ncbi:MAG: bifunctional [glutamate--ammonia ligase]-adenylyl-L-tyrosine phosphorylase/[glutamate--ammonia-ligase] adenylyltransferase [Gammaproteobacteria bacterium]
MPNDTHPPLSSFPTGLAEAERLWEAFAAEHNTTGLEARRDEILRVWAASPFVATSCLRNPDLLRELIQTGALDSQAASTATELSKAEDENAMMHRLRRLRQREMVRIAWRDIAGRASLDETLLALSSLARTCVSQAAVFSYEQQRKKYGVPRDTEGNAQHLVVLAMGKLGGDELNFSSDIDVIFTFPEAGYTDGGRGLDNRQFFVRVVRQLIKLLSEVTKDGFVFRVDARLRPFGEAGPMALSFDAMEHYYQTHGRDWERYALIKARAIAGDTSVAETLLARLRPFVYRKYMDYSAISALREMKSLINAEVKRRGLQDDIKLGPGGIREIEFIGQAFQLIRGGQDTQLQVRGIREVLPLLSSKGQLPASAVDELLAAYEFLRRAENRLQMIADEQTHRLPDNTVERARLAFAMGCADWEAFESALAGHRRNVHRHFAHLFADKEVSEASGATGSHHLWEGLDDGPQAVAALHRNGYGAADETWNVLSHFRHSRSYASLEGPGRERMDTLMPRLIALVGEHEQADIALPRVLKLIEAVARRSVYLSLLIERPVALEQLITLCAASAWIADYLSRHPLLLDELLDPRNLYAPPARDELQRLLQAEIAQVAEDDIEAHMERLRHFRHANVLRVAAADVMGALPIMKVSDRLTWIAEVILEQALAIALGQLTARHGRPCCTVDGNIHHPGFAVIGYGKLGGLELGYGSDLDIVFVHDSNGENQWTDGDKSVDNSVFFARLGQRIVHILTTFASAGRLYEVDLRLRPSGASGLLVTSLDALRRYQLEQAWTWEHQALVRARPVAGDEAIGRAFERVRAEVLQQTRDPVELRESVHHMREKMWREHESGEDEGFNLKKDPGGIADIEFMVQYAVLAHAADHPEVTRYSDNIRILDGLEECSLMTPAQAAQLRDIYRAYRDRVHELDLQDEASVTTEDEFRESRSAVRVYWAEMMKA